MGRNKIYSGRRSCVHQRFKDLADWLTDCGHQWMWILKIEEGEWETQPVWIHWKQSTSSGIWIPCVSSSSSEWSVPLAKWSLNVATACCKWGQNARTSLELWGEPWRFWQMGIFVWLNWGQSANVPHEDFEEAPFTKTPGRALRLCRQRWCWGDARVELRFLI